MTPERTNKAIATIVNVTGKPIERISTLPSTSDLGLVSVVLCNVVSVTTIIKKGKVLVLSAAHTHVGFFFF